MNGAHDNCPLQIANNASCHILQAIHEYRLFRVRRYRYVRANVHARYANVDVDNIRNLAITLRLSLHHNQK